MLHPSDTTSEWKGGSSALLNEMHNIGIALADAGVGVAVRNPDLKEVPARATLRVHLDTDGVVKQVHALPADQASHLWTLRDGQQNSFPFHQLKNPLLRIDTTDERFERLRNRRLDSSERWPLLLALAGNAEFNEEAFSTWPGEGYIQRLRERRSQLAELTETDAAAVPAVFERFVRSADDPIALLRRIADALVESSRQERFSDGDLPLIASLLTDAGGALFFDVTRREFPYLAGDARSIHEVSRALNNSTSQGSTGVCGVTGAIDVLVADKFPQPNLPILGQTYLFARNKDAPANARYGRSGTDSVQVGASTATALQAAIKSITREEWKDRTWRGIAGERPKQTDLFIAYVTGADDVRLAALLSEDASDAAPGAGEDFASLAERLTGALEGHVKARRDTELSLLVLRKVDPANRKVVLLECLSVDGLLAAARRWSTGCRNVPLSIRLLVPAERGEPARWRPVRDIAPFRLPRLTRQQFIRGGKQRQEIVGVTYDDAMRLFIAAEADPAFAGAILRRVLRGRGVLLEGVGHAQVRGFDDLKEFDRQETLDTITLLGLLLHKLGREKEEYMEDAAYKLGQLLASADVLHAAYNASERGGAALPPRLIGNAALSMAQTQPERAIAVLSGRWPVYSGWAQRKANQWKFPERFHGKRRAEIEKKDLAEYDRAQAIVRGLAVSRRLSPLASELRDALRSNPEVDDRFRAELLLGYMAGLPRGTEAPETNGNNDNPNEDGE